MDEKPIRAVEMVREIRDRLHEETKHMSPEEFSQFVTREANRARQDSHQLAEAQPAA